MKKRLTALLSAAALLLTATPLQAFAAADLELEAQPAATKCTAGNKVTMPVTCTVNSGYAAGIIDVEWDSTALTLTDVKYDADIAPANDPAPIEGASGKYRLAFGDYLAKEPFVMGGDFFVLEFTVAEGAKPGDYPVTLTDKGIYDQNVKKIQTDIQSSYIRIEDIFDMEMRATGGYGVLTPGLEVDVTVDAELNPGYAVGAMDAHWDPETLILKEIQYNSDLAPANQPAPIKNTGKYRVCFGSYLAAENFTGTGELFKMIFEVAEGAKADSYPVTFDNYDFLDCDINPMKVNVEGCVVDLHEATTTGTEAPATSGIDSETTTAESTTDVIAGTTVPVTTTVRPVTGPVPGTTTRVTTTASGTTTERTFTRPVPGTTTRVTTTASGTTTERTFTRPVPGTTTRVTTTASGTTTERIFTRPIPGTTTHMTTTVSTTTTERIFTRPIPGTTTHMTTTVSTTTTERIFTRPIPGTTTHMTTTVTTTTTARPTTTPTVGTTIPTTTTITTTTTAKPTTTPTVGTTIPTTTTVSGTTTADNSQMIMQAGKTVARIGSDAEILVPVIASKNAGYAVGSLTAHWNPDALVLKEVRYNEKLAPANQPAPVKNSGSYRVCFGNYLAAENFTGTGTLFTLVFTAAENAKPETAAITFDKYDFLDADINTLTATCSAGEVVLTDKEITTTAIGTTAAKTTAAPVTSGTALFTTTLAATTVITTVADFAPSLKWDNSPMKVGETRRMKVTNPMSGANVSSADIMQDVDCLKCTFDEKTSELVITALKPTEEKYLTVTASGCAFTAPFTVTILAAETTTTAPVTTTAKAVTTTTAPVTTTTKAVTTTTAPVTTTTKAVTTTTAPVTTTSEPAVTTTEAVTTTADAVTTTTEPVTTTSEPAVTTTETVTTTSEPVTTTTESAPDNSQVRLTAAKTTAKLSDKEIRVPVTAEANAGYAVGSVDVHWNADALKLTAVEYNEALAPANQPAPIKDGSSYRVCFGNYLATENFTGTGTMFTLVFAPTENAAADTYAITFDKFDFLDADINTVTASCTEGAVTLQSGDAPAYTLGDVNEDSIISVDDAQQVLREYVSLMAGHARSFSDTQFLAGDVNTDEKITVEDAQLILLYYVKNTLSHTPTTWDEIVRK